MVLRKLVFFAINFVLVLNHEAKDFDDSILYKIDFEVPDFEKRPDLKNQIKTFYTYEKEKYDCVIPLLAENKDVPISNDPELSPYKLLQPLFATSSCSYRIESFWSYEICHGHHVRQYHEEREGKNVKYQEYFLGKWPEEASIKAMKRWEDERKANSKIKTTKIENTNYPYFELEMTDGTMCDIINAPRTTNVRYVCYPHGKNEIYSIKEISSCNYEAIILTSALCMIPALHPEESKEMSIKCFNSIEAHKPLSMLRQELSDLNLNEDDFPMNPGMLDAAAALAHTAAIGDRYLFLKKLAGNAEQLVFEVMDTPSSLQVNTNTNGEKVQNGESIKPVSDFQPIEEFISGESCLVGGTGWWKYEFCYGRYVRQFHKDKKMETELFLGYFKEESHRKWLESNIDKQIKSNQYSISIWHHYEKGSLCDRTGLPREVDVKLTCNPVTTSAVSMYLLEPKTCQYILVVESNIICSLITLSDEFGLVNIENLEKLSKQKIEASKEPESKDSLESSKSQHKDKESNVEETPNE